MARAKVWENLGANQRKRYLGAGAKHGVSAAEVQRRYEAGESFREWAGHGPNPHRPGVTEYQWRQLKKAAKTAELGNVPRPKGRSESLEATILLETALQKGAPFDYQWLMRRLAEMARDRSIFRSERKRRQRAMGLDAGWQPGRKTYYTKYLGKYSVSSKELWFYH